MLLDSLIESMAYSITNLRNLDIHIGAFIQDAYQHVSEENQPDGFVRFLQRAEKERVYRGRFESPRAFLAGLRHHQMRAVKKQYGDDIRPDDDGVKQYLLRYNQALLPVINYYRELNYTPADQAKYRSINHAFITNGLRGGIAHLELSYRIVFVAYDVASLDAMVLAFLLRFHIAKNMERDPEFFPENPVCRHTSRGIDFVVEIDGESVSLSADFSDPTSIAAMHIPGTHEDGRIYAAEVTLTVNMPVIAGVSVKIPRPYIRVCMNPMPIMPTAWATDPEVVS